MTFAKGFLYAKVLPEFIFLIKFLILTRYDSYEGFFVSNTTAGLSHDNQCQTEFEILIKAK